MSERVERRTIFRGRVILPDRILADGAVLTRNGRIEAVDAAVDAV